MTDAHLGCGSGLMVQQDLAQLGFDTVRTCTTPWALVTCACCYQLFSLSDSMFALQDLKTAPPAAPPSTVRQSSSPEVPRTEDDSKSRAGDYPSDAPGCGAQSRVCGGHAHQADNANILNGVISFPDDSCARCDEIVPHNNTNVLSPITRLMLGTELRQAQERLAREQAARAEAVKRRLEAERRETERQVALT